jgi:low temperature requirement protein LtrA
VVAAEAVAITTVSSMWRLLSFENTRLVERNGLLTLIIIGEGIVGMTKSVATMVTVSAHFTSEDLGTIIAAVLLLVSSQSSTQIPLKSNIINIARSTFFGCFISIR